MTTYNYEELQEKAERAGQGHVFQYYNELSDAEKRVLLESASKVEFDKVNTYFKRVLPSLTTKAAEVKASNLDGFKVYYMYVYLYTFMYVCIHLHMCE